MWASDGIFYKKFYSIKKRDANVSVSLFLCKLLTTQHANHLKPNILTPNTPTPNILKPNHPTRQHVNSPTRQLANSLTPNTPTC